MPDLWKSFFDPFFYCVDMRADHSWNSSRVIDAKLDEILIIFFYFLILFLQEFILTDGFEQASSVTLYLAFDVIFADIQDVGFKIHDFLYNLLLFKHFYDLSSHFGGYSFPDEEVSIFVDQNECKDSQHRPYQYRSYRISYLFAGDVSESDT